LRGATKSAKIWSDMPPIGTPLPSIASTFRSHLGIDLVSASEPTPMLLVFLRHFGCTFCREAVCELEKLRPDIESLGTRLAFVHLSTDSRAEQFFAPHKFLDIPRFSDPDGRLYESFGLVHAKWQQYLNLRSIARMLSAWAGGHLVGTPDGDVERMPGVFLIHRGQILKSYRHKLVSDRPDYLDLARIS
jgi:peroxiredoxin